jgi:hypothetical protein
MRISNRNYVFVILITGLLAFSMSQFIDESSDDRSVGSLEAGLAEKSESIKGPGELGSWAWFLIGAWGTVALFFVISLVGGKGSS